MNRPNRIIKWSTRTVVGIGLIVLSVILANWMFRTAPRAGLADDAMVGPSVLVIASQPVDVAQQFTGYGVARAVEDADVPARVSSTVNMIPPTSRAGQLVRTGDLLVELDPTDFREEVEMARQRLLVLEAQLKTLDVEEGAARQSLEIAQQDLALTQRELTRVKEAAAKEVAMPREVDQVLKLVLAAESVALGAQELLDRIATSRLSLAAERQREEAAERLAMERVERCRITSPLEGFIEDIYVSQGESLNPGARVARIIDPRSIEVPLSLPASARRDVAVGDPVRLLTTGSRTRTWDARVVRISPEDDPSSRTMRIYAEVDQPMSGEDHLPPGAFLEGQVTAGRANTGWVVPRRSIRRGRILTVKDGIIESRPVDLRYPVTRDFPQFQLPDRDWVVLNQPLQEGELVVLSPSRMLADGMPVTPVDVRDSQAVVRSEDAAP